MYHTRKATKRHDKVYALLNMSSDDPSSAGLTVDYNTSWEEVFRKLIKFLLSDQIFVNTWEEVAIIKGKGLVLGEISLVERDDGRDDLQEREHYLEKYKQLLRNQEAPLYYQASAKPILRRGCRLLSTRSIEAHDH